MPPPALLSEENPTQALLSPPPSIRANFDVSQYLVDKSPIIGSEIEKPFDQYGSLLSHEIGDLPTSEEHLYSPSRLHSPQEQTLPRPSPSHPSSTGADTPLQFQEGDLQSQPDMESFILQMSDTVLDHTSSPQPSSDVGLI